MVALTDNLQNYGVLVRLVDKNLRHAALVGTVSALVSVPTTIVDGPNFVTIKDKYSGGEAIGGAIIGVGAVLIGISTVPEPASPVLFFVGVGLVGFGFGVTVTAGILDILKDSSTSEPEKPSSDNTKSEVDDSDGSDQDTIEFPHAIAIGEPPNGFDVDTFVTDLADFSVDLVLSDIPGGWDSDAGVGLPGVDDGGLDGGDGGGGINIPGV